MTDQSGTPSAPASSVPKEKLDVILRYFDDTRNLIAAGKVQRWEVVKWTVTLNVALAAAAAAFKSPSNAQSALVVAIAIALLGIVLVMSTIGE